MTDKKNHLVKNLCFGCIAGIYLGIVLFAIVVSIFFQSSFSGTTVLNGYAKAIVLGGLIGLLSAYCLYKIKGRYHDSNK